MPNWVSTNISITGSEDSVKRFVRRIGDKRILESYVPCPQELRETDAGSWSSDTDKQSETDKKYQLNIEKYGHKDWYDWSCAVWGTKWGDCDTHLEEPTETSDGLWEVSGHFQTAWSPATEGFLQVSKMFPTLLFTFEYDEEAGFFAGTEAIKAGQIVFQSFFEPCSYKHSIDWDDYESIDKYDEWKTGQSDIITEEYIEWLKVFS
jgi:hypothetical protein